MSRYVSKKLSEEKLLKEKLKAKLTKEKPREGVEDTDSFVEDPKKHYEELKKLVVEYQHQGDKVAQLTANSDSSD